MSTPTIAADTPRRPQQPKPQRRDVAKPGYRPDIDGLRSVSILLVVAYHAGWSTFAGGFVGVDVFFVLSGYLITGLLVAEHERHGTVSLIQFFARRARRLLPLASLAILVTLLVGWWLVSPLRRPALVGDGRAASLYFANWRFAARATVYSDVEVADELFIHFWSLSIEEQFYIFWPLVIVAVGWVARSSERSVRERLVAPLFVVAGVSFAFSVASATNGAAYFFTHVRIWELASGALLAVAAPRLAGLNRFAAELISLVCIGAIVVSATRFDGFTAFPGYAALVPVLGCVGLVAIGRVHQTWVASALSVRPMLYLGRLSYAWYLWHWPTIGLALIIAQDRDPAWPRNSTIAVAVLTSLALASLSHHLVEEPIRRSAFLSAKHSRSLMLGVLLTMTPVVAGIVLTNVGSASSPVSVADDAGALAMTPEDAMADRMVVTPAGCQADFEDTEAPPDCVFGDPNGSVTIALVGDSHALHWLPGLDRAGAARQWRILNWTKSSCPMIDVQLLNDRLQRRYDECDRWRENVLDRLAEAPDLDAVIVADSFNYAGMVLDATGSTVDSSQEAVEIWGAGARRLFDSLDSLTPRVVLLGDVPLSRRRVPDCLSESPSEPFHCEFGLAGAADLDAEFVAAEVAAGGELVRALPTTSIVCETDPCTTVTDDGIIKFRDRAHLTATFSRAVGGELADRLVPLIDER